MAVAPPIDWIKVQGITHGDTIRCGTEVGFYCESKIYNRIWCVRKIGRNNSNSKLIHNFYWPNITSCRAVLIEKTIKPSHNL